MKNKTTNIYSYLLLKVLLAFGALAAAQVAFHICNLRIFHLDGMREWVSLLLGNLHFGLATVAAFLLPYIILMLLPLPTRNRRWYRILTETLYIAAVLIMIIPRGCNSAYYQYTYRLLSDEIFSYLGISGQMGSLAPHFAVDYWFAWVCPLAIALVFFFLNKLIGRYEVPEKARADWRLVLSALLLILCLRGGVTHALQPADAARYVQPKNTALVNNDSHNILRTIFTPDLEEVNYMTAEEASTLSPFLQAGTQYPCDSATHKNVVIIILESFGQEFMAYYNTQADADTRTPFLDSIAAHSTTYDGRANGKKSIEGIMAINAGIPNLMSRPFANSRYGENDHYTGLPETLRRNGYHTAFYHGSYNGVMGFDSTCSKLGYDEYLGMDEYNAWNPGNSDYDGTWGIYDEPFLQYTADHISQTFKRSDGKPFMATVFTVTSHHPFPIPDAYKGRFIEGRHPILKCVEYTDNALRAFFETAKRQEWYANTLFIICGDHSGHGLTREYNDYDGWYRIPMIFFDPSADSAVRSQRIMQQTDIYPTLVDMLGLRDTVAAFGTSALREPQGHYVYYANGYHCLVSNNAADPTQHDISVIMGDYESGTPENLRLLKAIIQQYNHRIINDNLLPQ